MKPLIFALCVVFAFGDLRAQTPAWQPSPGHTQVPIWPAAVPDAQPVPGPENTATDTKDLVAGRPWIYVGKVSRPTMTVYSPQGKSTGSAVVVFSGGGYQILAIDLEGAEVWDWLTSKRITCVLLKYRVPGAVAIYPGHLSLAANSFGLNPDIRIHVTRQTPPTFLLQNEDDHVDRIEDSLSYYAALKKAGVPVEMHLYVQGGHAFGLRRTKLPLTAWPQLVETWLGTIGMISD